MDKPWFKLDPNNLKDPWWLYTSITDTETASMEKNELDVECYLVLKHHNNGCVFYRIFVWFKNDPNRYKYTIYTDEWNYYKKFNEGDIVNTNSCCKFKVYNCRFTLPSQLDFCKILERIEE